MPVRHVDLVDVFGEPNVFRPAADAIRDSGLGESAIEFLTTVGLPATETATPFSPTELEIQPNGPVGRAVVVGHGYGTTFCLVIATGEV